MSKWAFGSKILVWRVQTRRFSIMNLSSNSKTAPGRMQSKSFSAHKTLMISLGNQISLWGRVELEKESWRIGWDQNLILTGRRRGSFWSVDPMGEYLHSFIEFWTCLFSHTCVKVRRKKYCYLCVVIPEVASRSTGRFSNLSTFLFWSF